MNRVKAGSLMYIHIYIYIYMNIYTDRIAVQQNYATMFHLARNVEEMRNAKANIMRQSLTSRIYNN